MKKQYKKAKGILTRLTALALAVATILSMGAITGPPAASAASTCWPDLSYGYLEYTSPGSTTVYMDAAMSTPGTYKPSQAYDARIDRGDLLKIYGFTEHGSVILDYPVGNTRKVGFARISSLFGVSSPSEILNSAKASVDVYKITANGSKVRYGSTSQGDTVIKAGVSKSGDIVILYSAKNNDGRYMKAGLVSKESYDKLKNGSSASQSAQTTSNQKMSYALYKSSGGCLSCGFDCYSKTVGRHEGVDFQKAIGSSIYSLTSGTITRVVEGYRGGDGLSTIAIYSEETNKTVVYLHTNPIDSLKVGQYIKRGDKIATEDWRGISSAKSAHSHIEVRDGRKTHAAVSVGDSTLDNKNPKAFWESQGYKVK